MIKKIACTLEFLFFTGIS